MSNKYMRATVWEGKPYHMTVKDWPMPIIRDARDVIVRLTTAAICGSDLHDYHGMYITLYNLVTSDLDWKTLVGAR